MREPDRYVQGGMKGHEMGEPDAEVVQVGVSARRRFVAAITGLGLLVLAALAVGMRPTARANRLLRSVGLPKLPASSRGLRLERRGLGTGRAYLCFSVSAQDGRQFFAKSPLDPAEEPVPMASLHFSPRSPSWMQWGTAAQGRVFHFTSEGASVWLALDDGSNMIYVGVFEIPPPWFRWLFGS